MESTDRESLYELIQRKRRLCKFSLRDGKKTWRTGKFEVFEDADGAHLSYVSGNNFIVADDIAAHDTSICAVSIVSEDASRIVSLSRDRIAKFWQHETCIRQIQCQQLVSKVSISPEGRRFACVDERSVHVLHDGRWLFTLEGHIGAVNGAVFSPDGNRIATWSEDGTIRLWDTLSGHCIDTIDAPTRKMVPRGWAESPDKVLTFSQAFGDKHSNVYCVAFTGDSSKLVLGCADGTVYLYQGSKCLASFTGHTHHVRCISCSADSRYIVSGSNDETVKVWDTETGKLVDSLNGKSSFVHAVAVSADGSVIVSRTADGSIKVWRGARCVATLNSGDFGETLALSKDGETVVAGTLRGGLRIWKLSRTLIFTLPCYESSIVSIAFQLDGEVVYVVALHRDGAVRTIRNEQCVSVLQLSGATLVVFLAPDILALSNEDGRQCMIVENGSKIWQGNARDITFEGSTIFLMRSVGLRQNVVACCGPSSSQVLSFQKRVGFELQDQASQVHPVISHFGVSVSPLTSEQPVMVCPSVRDSSVTAISSTVDVEAQHEYNPSEDEESEALELSFGVDDVGCQTTKVPNSLTPYVMTLERQLDAAIVSMEWALMQKDPVILHDAVCAWLKQLRSHNFVAFQETQLDERFGVVNSELRVCISIDMIDVQSTCIFAGHCLSRQCTLPGGHVAALRQPLMHREVSANGLYERFSEHDMRTSVMDLVAEFEALSAIHSANVIRVIGFALCSRKETIVGTLTQFCAHGTLSHYIRQVPVTERLLFRIAFQAALALEAVHAAGFRHRDVHASAFFVCVVPVVGPVLKLGNLSMAEKYTRPASQMHVDDVCLARSYKPAFRFASPEYMASQRSREQFQLSISQDLWGYGHVLFECFVKKVPYEDETDELNISEFIREGKTPEWPCNEANQVPDWLLQMVADCWTTCPDVRASLFPSGFGTVIDRLRSAHPEWTQQLLQDLVQFDREEKRNIFTTACF
jgi:WD40 repeat protein/serine/threonine protein kinase